MDEREELAATVSGDRASRRAAARLSGDLDAMIGLAVDHSIANRLRSARRTALARLGRNTFPPSAHWINWAPVGLALAMVLVTSWSLLMDSAQSLDADLLADALPFDAYLDADFEASILGNGIELIEN